MKQSNIRKNPLHVLLVFIPVMLIQMACLSGYKKTEDVSDLPCYIQMLDSEMERNPEAWTLDFESRPKWR